MNKTRSCITAFVTGGLTLLAADASAQYVVVPPETGAVVVEEGAPLQAQPPPQYAPQTRYAPQPQYAQPQYAPQQPVVQDEQALAMREEREHRDWLILEATGAYGVNFGETSYIPSGTPGEYMHPIVHGFAVGATAGIVLVPGLALIGNYEYARSRSREGNVPGVIDEVQGHIDYHTIVAGLRLYHRLGFGTIHAEVAGGVVLPYETQLDIIYGPGLAAAGITGTGTQIERYSIGFGGHGMIGYEVPIFGPLYVALNIKLRTFQSENAGETTSLTNFVTDFTAQPPTATTADIHHGNGAASPSTNSVQDARLQLAVGARF